MGMDVTAEDIAHKNKSAGFVGPKGYKDGFTRLNALGNIYPICLQIKSMCHISAAQLEHYLITFRYLDHRFYRRAFIPPEGKNIIGLDLPQYPAFVSMTGQCEYFGTGAQLLGLQVAVIGTDTRGQTNDNYQNKKKAGL